MTEIVTTEAAAALPETVRPSAPRPARPLIVTVHGHCTLALNGAFALMGEAEPLETALARVEESIRAAADSP